MKNVNLDSEQQSVFDAIKNNPEKNFFIQGQAGTGKSTLIEHLKRNLGRRIAVVAPTGIAAELIGGTTIHSLFKLGGRQYFPTNVVEQYQNYDEVVALIDTLIIDEASMLRADIFDTVEFLCRKAKKSEKIFGGIQIVLVGDLYQLPPTYNYKDGATKEAKDYIVSTYNEPEPFFFDAKCYSNGNFETRELTVVHRQTDDKQFSECLRAISSLNTDENRQNVQKAIDVLNKRHTLYNESLDILVVTATNKNAKGINEKKLNKIKQPLQTYLGIFEGEYYENGDEATLIERKKSTQVPEKLELKVGAKVMICRNDNSVKHEYVNGTIGVVSELSSDNIKVKIQQKEVSIFPAVWEIQEYVKSEQDPSKLTLRTIGKYKQFPLKLAYAITIHKSQGQTLDEVCIDLGNNGAFACGQTYVALSRVRSFTGIHLVKALNLNDVKSNPRIQSFFKGEKSIQSNIIKAKRGENEKPCDFWCRVFPDIKNCEIHYSNYVQINCAGIRKKRFNENCFWFCLNKNSLNNKLYLICIINNNSSKILEIPAKALNSERYPIDFRVQSNDGRHDPARCDYKKSLFCDIFLSENFIEFKTNDNFDKFMLASEVNGQIEINKKKIYPVVTSENQERDTATVTAPSKEESFFMAANKGWTNKLRRLLDEGLKPDIRNNKGKTPLMESASMGHTDCAKLLLTRGADVNRQTNAGNTPLMFAIKGTHKECIQLLLSSGADVNFQSNKGNTPLIVAVDRGRNECVKLLLEAGADVNLPNNDGQTALFVATRREHKECVKLLLAAGADANLSDNDGRSPLMAAVFTKNTELMHLLISRGANTNILVINGIPLLNLVTCMGFTVAVRLLLEGGADVERCDKNKSNSLMSAAEQGHTECLRLLLSETKNVNAQDIKRRTPLSLAVTKGNTECVRLLLSAGADVNIRDINGKTSLIHAVIKGHSECVRLLLQQKDIDANISDNERKTPLMYAVDKANSDLCERLLLVGAEKEACDMYGRTALMHAAKSGHMDTVRKLCDFHANINAQDNCGKSVLWYARDNNRVREFLLSLGATE